MAKREMRRTALRIYDADYKYFTQLRDEHDLNVPQAFRLLVNSHKAVNSNPAIINIEPRPFGSLMEDEQ